MSESSGRPELPELPEGWAWCKLEELAAVEPNAFTDGPFGSNLKTEHYTDSGPRVVRLQNVGEGQFIDEPAHISQEHFERLRKHEAIGGDVVVAALGETLPRACLVPDALGPAIVKADCPRLRPHPEVNPAYIMYALNSPVVRAQAPSSHGVGRPRLNLSQIKALAIPLAPRPDQDTIASLVARLLEYVDRGKHEIARAQKMVDGYLVASLHDVFDGGTATEVVSLGEAADIRAGLTKGRKLKESTSNHPYLRADNVRAGEIDLNEVKEIPATAREAEKFRLEPGDVLFVEGSGSRRRLGEGWLWEGRIERCLHQNHVFRARPDTSRIRPRYLAWFLQAPSARAYFYGLAKDTSGLRTINRTQAAALPVPLPRLEDQDRAIATLDRVAASAASMRAELDFARAESEHLRRAVLAAAFMGRLSAPNGARETAEAIIRRIAKERRAARSSELKAAKKRRAVLRPR